MSEHEAAAEEAAMNVDAPPPVEEDVDAPPPPAEAVPEGDDYQAMEMEPELPAPP